MSKSPKNKTENKAAPPRTPPSRLGRGLSALMSDIAPSENSALAGGHPPPANTTPRSEAQAENSVPAEKADSPRKAVKSSAAAVQNKGAARGRGVATLAIDQIVRNPDQPRRYFDKTALAELTQSIADKGVLQPILVRPVPSRDKSSSGKPLYQIVAGERRWQASLTAKLTSMPVLIRDLSDRDVLEIGVVENVQRADLNPIEEALAYRALVDQFGRSQNEIAQAIGKSRPHIANMLRLLTLPKRAQEALQSGEITTGHARAVIAAPDPDALVEQIIEKGLSVRDAEGWVRRIKAQNNDDLSRILPPAAPEQKSADIKMLEQSLSDKLGLKVVLRYKGPGGELRINFSDDHQLSSLLKTLGHD
jgi:ParB family chromosome partitioning protein